MLLLLGIGFVAGLVTALSPCVLPQFRRHGVGRMLMESAVAYAEEVGVPQVTTAVTAGSRDGNRFMARLGLTQLAVVRAASVQTLRAKLPVEPPPVCLTDSRHHRTVGQVLARRRSLRRAQAKAT